MGHEVDGKIVRSDINEPDRTTADNSHYQYSEMLIEPSRKMWNEFDMDATNLAPTKIKVRSSIRLLLSGFIPEGNESPSYSPVLLSAKPVAGLQPGADFYFSPFTCFHWNSERIALAISATERV